MSVTHISFFINPSEIVAVYINSGDSGTAPVFLSKRVGRANDEDTSVAKIFTLIKKEIEKNGLQIPDENDRCVIVSSSPLVKTGIFAVTEEWSMNYALKAASSMMLDVKWASGFEKLSSEDIDQDVRTILVSGGYDSPDVAKTDYLIRSVSQIEWIRKKKPFIIYRGNKNVVDTAKLFFSPFTGFVSLKNVLTGNPSECSENVENIVESIYLSECGLSDKTKKYRLFVFSNIVKKTMELLCAGNSPKIGACFINKRFSIFSDCEKRDGKHFFKRFSIAKETSVINSSDFSKGYGLFFDEADDSVISFNLNGSSVFPVPVKKDQDFYRPKKIAGIVFDSDITFDKFLNLISEPDILRGNIELIYDSNGYLPALTAMIIKNDADKRTDFSEIVDNSPVRKGWLIIPDGKYEKDNEAVVLQIRGTTKIESVTLLWGKRYIYDIEQSSIVEIAFAGKAFLNSLKEKILTLKTDKGSRTLIIDLRKEKS